MIYVSDLSNASDRINWVQNLFERSDFAILIICFHGKSEWLKIEQIRIQIDSALKKADIP